MPYVPLAVFIPIFTAIGVYDFRKAIVPNKMIYAGALLAIVLNLIFSGIRWDFILGGGVIAFVFGLAVQKFTGAGDIKYMGMIGLLFGYPWFIPVIAGGFVIGGAVVAVNHFVHPFDKNNIIYDSIEFGPFLSLSAVAVAGWLLVAIFRG